MSERSMTGPVRLVRALVACYPAGWRRRYGDEYAQLLCDLRIHRHPAMIVDSLRGAVRAHGGVLMTGDAPMTAVVWAAGLFTVAGLGFAKLAENFTDARGAYTVLGLAAAVALLALAGAAAPAAVALLRGRDRGAWKYVAVPFVGVAVWFGVLGLSRGIAAGHGPRSGPTVAAFLLLAATGTAVVAATAWAAVVVLRRLPAGPPARLRPAASATTTAGMAVATGAALIWGLQIRSGDPAAFHGNDGLLATSFVPSWIAVTAGLAIATVLAAYGARRQLAAG